MNAGVVSDNSKQFVGPAQMHSFWLASARMYFTYILLCTNLKDNKTEFYTGSCEVLENRLNDHIRNSVKTTKGFDKIELVYYEACLNKTDARKRELQLKTGFGRGYIKRRIESYLKNLRA